LTVKDPSARGELSNLETRSPVDKSRDNLRMYTIRLSGLSVCFGPGIADGTCTTPRTGVRRILPHTGISADVANCVWKAIGECQGRSFRRIDQPRSFGAACRLQVTLARVERLCRPPLFGMRGVTLRLRGFENFSNRSNQS